MLGRSRQRKMVIAGGAQAVADYLFGLPGDNLLYRVNETTGSVAAARNDALAYPNTRDVIINGAFISDIGVVVF